MTSMRTHFAAVSVYSKTLDSCADHCCNVSLYCIVSAYASVLVWIGETRKKRYCGCDVFDVFSVK